MAVDIRLIEPHEVPDFIRSVQVPFLEVGEEGAVEHWTPHLEVDRCWIAQDGGRAVGNCCVFSRDVTVPARRGRLCPTVPMAAVSGVGVHPTHRRQGLLRRMMGVMFDDARKRGEMVTGLTASESVIYGRYGYGLATTAAELAIDTRHAAFAPEAPRLDLRILDPDEAVKELPERFDRLRRRRAGEVSRNHATWTDVFADRPATRGGGGGRIYAAGDDGFVTYRGHQVGEGDSRYTRIEVRDLYGSTPEAEAALWRFVFDLDLAHEVRAFPRPVDDPLRWRLADPRQLRARRADDFLWLGILDTAGALEARGYETEGRVVLDVAAPAGAAPLEDQADADAATLGRWVLEAGPDDASCRRGGASDEPDVHLDLSDLGALYLGGVSASALAAAGRVAEGRAGGVTRVDGLLATAWAPFTGTGF